MRKIKLFLSMLMLIAFSVGNVWATDAASVELCTSWSQTFAYATAYTHDYTIDDLNGSTTTMTLGVQGVYRQANANTYFQMNKKAGYFKNTTALPGKITKIETTWSAAKGATKCYFANGAEATSSDATVTVSAGTSVTYTPDNAADYYFFNIDVSTGSGSAQMTSCVVYYEKAGGDPTPSVSVTPASWDFGTVHASAEASKVFSVSGSNLTAGTLSISVPAGFSVSPSSISVTEATLAATNVTVSKNTTAIDDYSGNLSISATCGLTEAKTVALEMSVVADPEPTGTFELFSGDIEEGDYVLVGYQTSSSKYYAMNSTVTSNQYLGITEVSIDANDQIVNPDASLVWTIEQSTNGYYIKQGSAYLDDNATSNKNYAQTVAEPTTTSEWAFAYDNTWTITNYGTETTKKTLSFNISASRVACYTAIQSGNTCFYLYKKVDGAVKPSAGLAFETSAYLVKANGSLATPTLSTADGFDGTVTYASSDADVVAVNTTTGALTIKAAGKAEITASSLETENFKAGSAKYTVYVAEQAGTAEEPLTEASAKALIDLGCTLNAHVNGIVLSQNSTNFTVTLTNGFQFYKAKDLNNVAFESAYLGAGDEVTAVGALKKFSSTYELDEGCYLTFYEAATTSLTPIANDKDHPYTVAQALAFAAAPTTYDLSDHVFIQGVVYKANSFNSDNGTYNIYIKDAGTSEDDGKFEFFKCSGLYQVGEDVVPFEEGDVQEGDEVIGYGVMTYYSGGSIWEFGQPNQLVSLNRPAVAVTGIDLTESTAEVEVGSTVTLHASVVPGNATDQGIVWSVTSGSDKASVDENGVVTGTAAGEAVIRAASHEDVSIYEECTVTVTAVDPTKHVVTFDATLDYGDSPLVKGDITMTCTSGALNNQSEYRLYKNGTTTFECSAGNIIKIEFTGVSGNPISGFGDPEVGTLETSGNDGVWTGNAESVAFAASGAQVRATLIKVTYKEDNRDAAGLAWNPAGDIELTVGDAFSAPALLNPNSIDAAEISIASSNTDVATVTAGVVSLVADATGTTTITATFAGNDDYKPATISYNITVNEAGLDNVTFDSSEDHAESGETTITKGGFTLSFTSGSMDGTQAEYRLYKSQTMTLSSTDYLIKKIEFTCTSGNPITGFADATGLDKDNNEWTGESNTVELTASNAQVRMTKIKVFYVEDTRAAAGLAWDPADDIELTVGDALSAPALQNPNNIAENLISITSSNTDLATVTAGEVALVADATGTTTITATFAGNDDFKPATVSYKITVNPAHSIYVSPSLNVNFGNVDKDAEVADKTITVTLTGVDAATLTLAGDGASAFTISPAAALTASGDITISASSANLGTFAATLTISDDASQAESKVVHLSLTVNEVVVPETQVSTTSQWVAATEIADGMEVLIVGEDNGTFYAMSEDRGNNRGVVAGTIEEGVFTPGANTMAFTLVAQDGGTYALRASNGKYLYAGGTGNSNWLNTKAYDGELDANAKWNIDLTNSTIIATSSNRNEMRFNKNNNPKIISCYQSSSTSPTIALYVPKAIEPEWVDIRPGATSGKYYTVCLPKKVVDFRGGNFWSMSKRGDGIAYLEEATGTLPAGTPYIFEVTGAKLEVVYEGDATDVAGTNGALHGTFVAMDQDALSAKATDLGSDIYLLSNNQLWNVTTGGASGNSLAAGRAYIVYDELVNAAPAPGRRVRAIPMGQQTATGIDALNTSETPVKTIINGELFIIRGEKMYDATGRLVK